MNSEQEVASNTNIDKCTVVLVDIAGTTTSVAFVKEELFTFAKENAQNVLKDNWEDEEVKKAVKFLQDGDAELNVDGALEVFKKLTDEDSDNQGVKTLQGLIYKKGYADGKLKAHVYSDVPKAFENWIKERKVGVYSTGSVESQKLLFAHSVEGELSTQISYYFDQSVGNKTETNSYKKIAEELKVKTEEILFVSDSVDELKAAKEAGLIVILIKREGNAEIPEEVAKQFNCISSFLDISFDNTNKRKNEEEVDGTEGPPTKVPKTESENEISSSVESSTKMVTELVEVKEHEPEKKTEDIAKKNSDIKEQKPIEESKTETEVEPMEVDAPEVENSVIPSSTDDKKAVTVAESNIADDATSKENNSEITKNPETAMETEQGEKTVKKTETEPVSHKTDIEKSADPADGKKTLESEKESTTETETKTEESEPKNNIEVSSNSEKSESKENGIKDVKIENLDKGTDNKANGNVEVAEEAIEVTKEVESNTVVAENSVEMAEEATKINVENQSIENKSESNYIEEVKKLENNVAENEKYKSTQTKKVETEKSEETSNNSVVEVTSDAPTNSTEDSKDKIQTNEEISTNNADKHETVKAGHAETDKTTAEHMEIDKTVTECMETDKPAEKTGTGKSVEKDTNTDKTAEQNKTEIDKTIAEPMETDKAISKPAETQNSKSERTEMDKTKAEHAETDKEEVQKTETDKSVMEQMETDIPVVEHKDTDNKVSGLEDANKEAEKHVETVKEVIVQKDVDKAVKNINTNKEKSEESNVEKEKSKEQIDANVVSTEEHMDTDKVITEESRVDEKSEIVKPSEIKAVTESCTAQEPIIESSSDKIAESSKNQESVDKVDDLSSVATSSSDKPEPSSTENCAVVNQTKENKDQVEESKCEVGVSKSITTEETARIEEVTTSNNDKEKKLEQGSCDSKKTEDITKNGEITNGQENGDEKNEETDPEETDIKIKKLEANAGSPAVSVEV